MKKKILFVEDDYGDRFVPKRKLEKEDFEVVVAETVEDAIDLAEKKNPNLILLDIRLPQRKGMKGKMDMEGGYKVAEALKDRKIPIIFTSVYEDEEDIRRGMDLGAIDFYIKPFSTKALVERIREILQ
ncbi:MAG: response regulator [bacterium]